MLSSVPELHGYIDKSQLTEDLGGTLDYCHTRWLCHRTVSLPSTHSPVDAGYGLWLAVIPGETLRIAFAFRCCLFQRHVHVKTQVFSPRMRRWSQWTLVIQRNNMSNKFGSGFLWAQRLKRKREKAQIVVDCSTHASLNKERDPEPRMTLADESLCKECLVCV